MKKSNQDRVDRLVALKNAVHLTRQLNVFTNKPIATDDEFLKSLRKCLNCLYLKCVQHANRKYNENDSRFLNSSSVAEPLVIHDVMYSNDILNLPIQVSLSLDSSCDKQQVVAILHSIDSDKINACYGVQPAIKFVESDFALKISPELLERIADNLVET